MELIKITMELLSPSRGDFFDKNKYNKKNEIFTDLINELKKFNLKWNVDELDIDINILFKDYKQSKDEH